MSDEQVKRIPEELAITIYLHYMKHFLGREDVSRDAASVGSVHVSVTKEIIEQALAALEAENGSLRKQLQAFEISAHFAPALAAVQQQVAALEARNKEADSYLKRYEERTMWGTDSDNDVKLARAALEGAS